MRLSPFAGAALALLSLALFSFAPAAVAQQQQRAPARPQPQAQQPAAPEPPPGFFPCRTAQETCHIGVVTGANQVAILFSNAPPPPAPPAPPPAQGARGGQGRQAQAAAPAPEIGDKPVAVTAGDAPGTPLDLNQHLGRVVMLTGTLDPAAGLTKAELVEVASPLLSFALKGMLTGDDAPPSPGRAPARR